MNARHGAGMCTIPLKPRAVVYGGWLTNERTNGGTGIGIAQPNWVIIYSVNARARSMSLSKLCHSYVVHLRNEVFLPLHTLYWSEPKIKPETDPTSAI